MSLFKLVVVDSGIGNLRSVEKALAAAATGITTRDIQIERSADADVVRRADAIVVPGQGGFRDCARWLASGMGDVLRERLQAGVPYLGICLGLQILFETSEEAPGTRGLGWFPGAIRRLDVGPDVKVPHMGWNQVTLAATSHPVLEQSNGSGTSYYFIHSYHAVPDDPTLVRATAHYGTGHVTAAIARDHVLATQFHPEKSQSAGLKLLNTFLKTTGA